MISRNDMKRILASALLLLLLLPLPTASAHPGRTDGNGGHTDRSTGEYHYHHGYSAHQHTDLDGDGKKDCPYDFKDKTGSSSGSSRTSNTRKTTYSVTPKKSSWVSPLFWNLLCLLLIPGLFLLPVITYELSELFGKIKTFFSNIFR